MVNKTFCKTQLRAELSAFYAYMFDDYRNPPHPLIQSYFIMLWANVDIHFAMNYILSAYCMAFDEVAVVTLLKQLTVCSGADGIYVGVIKAIWDELLLHDVLKEAVLSYSSKNVASHSLLTLAVHDPEMDTFERLLIEAIDANQNITLAVYNFIIQRLKSIPEEELSAGHRSLIRAVWKHSVPLLLNPLVAESTKLEWTALMMMD